MDRSGLGHFYRFCNIGAYIWCGFYSDMAGSMSIEAKTGNSRVGVKGLGTFKYNTMDFGTDL